MTDQNVAGFDAGLFLNTTVDTALQTKSDPIPIGPYRAVIKDLGFRTGSSEKGPWIAMDVSYSLDAPDVATKLNRKELTARQSGFITLDSNGKIASGPNQNVWVGKIFEAVGMNKPGVTIGQLKGAGPLQVMIGHRPNKDDATIVYDEVKSVAKAA